MANGRIIRPSKIEAVIDLYGDSSYHMADANGNVKWKDDHETTEEEKAAIDAKIIELQAEYDAQEYARNRAEEYPSTGDQLDYIFHNGVAKWKTDMIEPVKAKYPKPS